VDKGFVAAREKSYNDEADRWAGSAIHKHGLAKDIILTARKKEVVTFVPHHFLAAVYAKTKAMDKVRLGKAKKEQSTDPVEIGEPEAPLLILDTSRANPHLVKIRVSNSCWQVQLEGSQLQRHPRSKEIGVRAPIPSWGKQKKNCYGCALVLEPGLMANPEKS
jgi:hypothetical protein